MSLFDIIHPLAANQGVPDRLWLTIAQMETGLNPGAIGDNGTSFGLFQLHIGGQANAALNAGFSTQQLLDPAINARFGLPAIANTWNALKGSFNDSVQWWTQFASMSGHPGGSTSDPHTQAVGATLKNIYDKNSFGISASSLGTSTTGTQLTSLGTSSSVNGVAQLGTFFTSMGLDLLVFTVAIAVMVGGIALIK